MEKHLLRCGAASCKALPANIFSSVLKIANYLAISISVRNKDNVELYSPSVVYFFCASLLPFQTVFCFVALYLATHAPQGNYHTVTCATSAQQPLLAAGY